MTSNIPCCMGSVAFGPTGCTCRHDLLSQHYKIDDAIDAAWDELLENDDRPLPAEYPELVLISRAELASFMRAVAKGGE